MNTMKKFAAVAGAAVLLLSVAPASAAPKESPAPPPNTRVEIRCQSDIYNGLGFDYTTGAHPKDEWLGMPGAGFLSAVQPLGFGDKWTESGVIAGQPPKWRDAGDAAILCRWGTKNYDLPPESGTVWLDLDIENKVDIEPSSIVDVECGTVSGQYVAPSNVTQRWEPVDPANPTLRPVDFGERRAIFVDEPVGASEFFPQDFSLLPPFGPKNTGALKNAVDCSYSTVVYNGPPWTTRYRVTGTVYGTLKANLTP